MLQVLTRFFLRIIIISVILALLHWALTEYTALALSSENLFGMHMFIVGITLVSYTAVVWVWKKSFDKIGFAFLGISILKMMASLLYLLPLLRVGGPGAENTILHFFAAYFIYLFIEALAVLKLLRNEPDTNPSGGQ